MELRKEPEHGIGLTIVGGESAGKLDLGIFVRSITPGGPADRDGRLRTGDRIISINGQSLEGMPHHRAVELIRESPMVVQMVVSQSTIPLPQSPTSSASFNLEAVEEMMAARTLISGRDGVDTPGTSSNRSKVSGVADQSIMMMSEQSHILRSLDLPSDDSDLELEDIVPPEALKPDFVRRSGLGPVSSTPTKFSSKSKRTMSPHGMYM